MTKETKVMTVEHARNICADIMKTVNKHGLWCTVEEEHKPDVRIIRIKEISIKVGKEV